MAGADLRSDRRACLVRSRRPPGHAHAVDDEPDCVYLRLVPLDGSGPRRQVRVPDVGTDEVGVAGRTVWLVRTDGGALVTVDVAGGEVSEIALAIASQQPARSALA